MLSGTTNEASAKRYRTISFCVSALCFPLCCLFLWGDRNPVYISTLSISALTSFLVALQFGSRMFQPTKASERTPSLSDERKMVLRAIAQILSVVVLASLVVSLFSHRIFGDGVDSELFFFSILPLMSGPDAIFDLIGEASYNKSAITSSGARIDWTDAKPIHSEHWGESSRE